MYRLKNNGLQNQVSLQIQNASEKWVGQEVMFRICDNTIHGYIAGEFIGALHDRKELRLVQYLLEQQHVFYAWVESIYKRNIVVAIARPTELIRELETVSINLGVKAGVVQDLQRYTPLHDYPFSFQYGALYIAREESSGLYYLFSNEQPKQQENRVLVLRWKQDQLFVEEERRLNYKALSHQRLLAQAKVFDAQLTFYETNEQRPLNEQVRFPYYFEKSTQYLASWNEYLRFEQQLLEQKATRCGMLAYERYEMIYGKLIFHLKGQHDLSPWYEEVGNVQVELKGESASFSFGTLRRVTNKTVEVDCFYDDSLEQMVIPNHGELIVSKSMGQTMMKRRQSALDKTLSGLAVLPDLGQILSDPTCVENHYRVDHRFPMPTVPRLLNNQLADLYQEQALNAALNTDNIMLIQGPPGTGKTAVIQTLMKCFIEIGQQEILLTSYQHLAVDNAMEGLATSGMLAHRFGGDTHMDQMLNSYKKIVQMIVTPLKNNDALYTILEDEHYSQTIATMIQSLMPYIEGLDYQKVQQLAQLMANLADEEALSVQAYLALFPLQQAVEEAQQGTMDAMPLNATLYEEYATLQKQAQQLTSADVKKWKSFLEKLQPVMNANQLTQSMQTFKQVKRARQDLVMIKNDNALQQHFMEQLAMLDEQCKIIVERPSAANVHTYEPLEKIVKEVIIELQTLESQSEAEKLTEEQKIIKDYTQQLENDPLNLAKLVGRYAQVKGVTCQQAVAYRHGLYDTIFDVVIIDEAARANPLDLLIPMALGKKIILVGDHKQLPHILEPAFEQEHELVDHSFEEIYKKSLFERLYQQLPITKKVMLTKQFRMTPVIGELVSRLFYDGHLEHGLTSEQLVNDTGMYNERAIAWLDIPYHVGGEQGRYINREEAQRIITEVRQLLEKAPQYDGRIGVITFYKEQQQLLETMLESAGLQKRVQCGTVDAFQGKECDVIYLSTVRSNQHKKVYRALGFLRSRNRFNVALSRARRLVVIVGDAATLRQEQMFADVYTYIEEHGYIGNDY